MYYMFYKAAAFNQPIGYWDVGRVENMEHMLYGAAAFKQDLSKWNVAKVGNFTLFLYLAALPTESYNRLLMRWSRLPLKTGVTFHGGSSTYDLGLPAECRARLADTFGWSITDGGSTGRPYVGDPTTILLR